MACCKHTEMPEATKVPSPVTPAKNNIANRIASNAIDEDSEIDTRALLVPQIQKCLVIKK